MRFEPRQAFFGARPVLARGCAKSSAPDLPAEIAFLKRFFISEAALQEAATRAQTAGACAARTLIAEGGVSAALYYRALACHLGLDFVADWPQVVPIPDPAAAHRTERIRMDGDSRGRWLIAPTEADILLLLKARRLGLKMPDIAITTPLHLAAIIRHRAQSAVEHAATDAFPRAAPRMSAKGATDKTIGAMACMAAVCLALSTFFEPRLVGALFCLIFFASTCFRLIVCSGGLGLSPKKYRRLNDAELPFYSVLVPLHREDAIIPALVDRLKDLDYPPAKLEILILVEPEDRITRDALASVRLPPWFQIVVGPDQTNLRTKPRALKIGLLAARGSLLTVYDAEDRPDPEQLRRAAAHFHDAPATLACLQARLAMDRATGLLPRLFAVEYAALFDLYNIGIARFGLPLALGGTSNHFRTYVLRSIGGWDAWNVTEDADLGLRLARLGYEVVALDSTTFETAPTKLSVWIKQRRRWTKGWMQTFLVLARDAPSLRRELGWKRFGAVGLMAVNLVAGPLLMPFFSGLVLFNLAASGLAQPHGLIELLESTLVYSVLLLGVGAMVWPSLLGMRIRKLANMPILLALILPYTLLISAAAMMGLRDLIQRPYHWHKTPH